MPDSNIKFFSQGGKRQILVVEDELINREILGMILGSTYELIFAENGSQAIDALRDNADTLCLILLDLILPDIHGLDLLSQFKGDPRYAGIPVIVMTADKDAEVESLTRGAVDFIPKPYPPAKVIHARILRTIELYEGKDIIRQTERDPVTGLYNKEYFYRYASQLDLYQKDRPMDAVVIDIHRFHILNERYGKVIGDDILRRLGKTLQEAFEGSGAIACRREADTFLIYTPHIEDYQGLLDTLSATELGRDARMRLRMGIYPDVDKAIDIERRFDRAKLAADTLKGNYNTALAFYDDSLHDSEVFSEQLLEEFSTALSEKQFKVYFQPKFNVTGDMPLLSSAEALVRWEHPTLGLVSPAVFVPLFENNGLIRELDSYVWREAAWHVSDWKKRLGISVPVSVNVSRVDLCDPNIIEQLVEIIETNGLLNSEYMLEITESAYTENSEQIVDTVSQLRSRGFFIEMDDFGSGYSSLNMLSTLPIDALKLDMQFIRNAFKERKDTRLLEMVLGLADALSVATIAEGVETAEQMFTLKSMGCDVVQGYYFSRPLPADKFETYILGHRQIRKLAAVEADTSKTVRKDWYTYDAMHDSLTGMYNSSAFEVLFHDSDHDHIAVLIADVDDYAEIQRQHGHAFSDAMIKKIADVLKKQFRSVDHICRIKNDEFAVIMTRITRARTALVLSKVDTINKILANPGEGELPMSLSFGIAFSDRENPCGDTFQDADTALNRLKNEGRRGYEIY